MEVWGESKQNRKVWFERREFAERKNQRNGFKKHEQVNKMLVF